MNGWLVTNPLMYNIISKTKAGLYPPGNLKLHISSPKIPVNINVIVTPYLFIKHWRIYHVIHFQNELINLLTEKGSSPTSWSRMPMASTILLCYIFRNVSRRNLRTHSKWQSAFVLLRSDLYQICWTYKLVSELPNMSRPLEVKICKWRRGKRKVKSNIHIAMNPDKTYHGQIIHLMDHLFQFDELVFHRRHLQLRFSITYKLDQIFPKYIFVYYT